MHCKSVLNAVETLLSFHLCARACRVSHRFTDIMFHWVIATSLSVCLSFSDLFSPYSVEEWSYASRSVSQRGGNLLGPCASLGWQMGRISLTAIWTAWHGQDAAVA